MAKFLRGLFGGNNANKGPRSGTESSPDMVAGPASPGAAAAAVDSGDADFVHPALVSETTIRKRYKITDFEPIGSLGKGSFGHVYLVRRVAGGNFSPADLATGPTDYAMKVISKQMVLDKGKVKDVYTERAVLYREGTHPFVVNLYYSFHNDDFVFFVMDNAPCGDLSSYLTRQPGMRIPEAHARIFAAEVFVGLTFLHRCGVMYRDLKPENILLSSLGHAMLCDFGLSKIVRPDPSTIVAVADDDVAQTFVGSPYYVAPDVLKQTPYTVAVDWWSYGVLVYHVLCGRPPFGGRTMKEIFQKILFRELMWPAGTEEFVSPTARSFCERLLAKDPTRRAKEEEVRRHPWFAGIDWAELKGEAVRSVASRWASALVPARPRPLSPEDLAIFRALGEASGGTMDVDAADAPRRDGGAFDKFSYSQPLKTGLADEDLDE